MKYITFAIPSYNSQDYLKRCVDSLLPFEKDAEIIIINDGSKDQTLKIALEYKKKYPKSVKVIDKENGGHGSGVNAGLEHAEGIFYKVVDSDDWIDQEKFRLLLDLIKKHVSEKSEPDLYITNFTYNHVEDHTFFIRNYTKNFPKNQMFDWSEIKKPFRSSATLLMHALYFKTERLRKSQTVLPHHTFYVDNIFVFKPLPYIHKIYYIEESIYQYYIGRNDQSITLENISKNYKQQINVMKHMVDMYTLKEINAFAKGLRQYMKHHLTTMMIITQMFTVSKYSIERKNDLHELWKYVKSRDKHLYRFLKYNGYNIFVTYLPFKLKSIVMVKAYKILKKRIKLG